MSTLDRDAHFHRKTHPPEVKAITGTVKWYDPKKGFGFVAQESGAGDALLTEECLQRSGYLSVVEGAKVACGIVKTSKGWKVQSIFISSFPKISFMPDPARVGKIPSDAIRVQVLRFRNTFGYGFLSRGPGTKDIYVNKKTLRDCGFRGLAEGQWVWAQIVEKPEGPAATAIYPAT